MPAKRRPKKDLPARASGRLRSQQHHEQAPSDRGDGPDLADDKPGGPIVEEVSGPAVRFPAGGVERRNPRPLDAESGLVDGPTGEPPGEPGHVGRSAAEFVLDGADCIMDGSAEVTMVTIDADGRAILAGDPADVDLVAATSDDGGQVHLDGGTSEQLDYGSDDASSAEFLDQSSSGLDSKGRSGQASTAVTTATFVCETEWVKGVPVVTLKGHSPRSHSYLFQALSEEFEEPKFSDACFRCSDGEVKCHKVVLASLSPLLRRALREAINDDEAVVITPDVSRDDLAAFLSKAYGGGVETVDIQKTISHIGFSAKLQSYKVREEVKWEVEGETVRDSFNVSESGERSHGRSKKNKALGKYSLIWNYFQELENSTIAECLECFNRVSIKGGKTSGMIQHINRKHPGIFEKYADDKAQMTADNEYYGAIPASSLLTDAMEKEKEEIIIDHPEFNSEENDESIVDEDMDDKPLEAKRAMMKKRSPVWNYFRKIDEAKAECSECLQVIGKKLGKTSAMIRHLKRAHPENFAALGSRTVRSNRAEKIRDSLQAVVEDTIGSDVQRNEEAPEQPGAEEPESRRADVVVVSLGGKRSLVWNHFKEIGSGKAKCLECFVIITKNEGTTSGMFSHLKRHHQEIYRKVTKEQEAVRKGTTLTALKNILIKEEEEEDVHVKEEEDEDEVERSSSHVICSESDKRKRSAIWSYYSPTNDPSLHTCMLCSKTLSSKKKTSNMIRHLQRHHLKEYNMFLKESGYEKREQEAKPPRRPKVPKEEPDDPNDKTCPDCLKLYSTRKAMLYHRKVVHSGIKPFTCEHCGVSFARHSSFLSHTHSTTRSFLCSICGKMFLTKNTRARHERSHFGDQRHQCSFCDRRFLTTQQKKNHELVHTGEKPFSCDDCGKLFARIHQLRSHARIHTGEKPYECLNCNQYFRHLSSRNNHKCPNSEREYMPPRDSRIIINKKRKIKI